MSLWEIADSPRYPGGPVRGLQSAIGKCVRLGYKPRKRLPGVLWKRNLLVIPAASVRPGAPELPVKSPAR